MKYYVYLSIAVLAVCTLLSPSAPVQAAFANCYELDKSSGSPISGYGASYNFLSSSRELLLKATCDRDAGKVRLTIGTGNANQIIYAKGYMIEQTGSTTWSDWINKELTFQGTPLLTASGTPTGYLIASSTLDVSRSGNSLDRRHAFIAYICTAVNGNWKCGCSNVSCTTGKWQLQFFNFPEEEEEEEEEEEDEPQTHTFNISGSGTSFSDTDIEVNEGDTVVINFSSVEGVHDINFDEFDVKTDLLSAGESETITFVADEAGEFEYYCSPHKSMGMVGTLTVN